MAGLILTIIDLSIKLLVWLARKPEIRNRVVRWIREVPGKRYAPLSAIGLNDAAVILAAGSSLRWEAGIDLERVDATKRGNLEHLYWEKVAEPLRFFTGKQDITPEQVFREVLDLDIPDRKEAPHHKALAQLYYLLPIIQLQFIRYYTELVEKIIVVITGGSPNSNAQEEIRHHINLWNSGGQALVEAHVIEQGHEVTYSAYEGLRLAKVNDYGYTIISYSDIVWEKKLLNRLLKRNSADIIIAVYNKLESNYPNTRIWHDMRWAEVVCGEKGKIQKVGELVDKFTNVSKRTLGNDANTKKCLQVFKDNKYLGEIIGLFMFSPKGRDIFIETYDNIINKQGGVISFNEWIDIRCEWIPTKGTTKIQDCLLGCFLEYLSRHQKELGIKVKILHTDYRWVQIDHWGDLGLARKRFPLSSLFK